MADTTIYWKQGNTGPPVTATFTDDIGGPLDIAGATVTFHMSRSSSDQPKINAAAANHQNGDGSDGTKGQVSYAPTGTDTDTPGRYEIEFKATFADQTVVTFPNVGYGDLLITARLAA